METNGSVKLRSISGYIKWEVTNHSIEKAKLSARFKKWKN